MAIKWYEESTMSSPDRNDLKDGPGSPKRRRMDEESYDPNIGSSDAVTSDAVTFGAAPSDFHEDDIAFPPTQTVLTDPQFQTQTQYETQLQSSQPQTQLQNQTQHAFLQRPT